jgi:hypothetical protein
MRPADRARRSVLIRRRRLSGIRSRSRRATTRARRPRIARLNQRLNPFERVPDFLAVDVSPRHSIPLKFVRLQPTTAPLIQIMRPGSALLMLKCGVYIPSVKLLPSSAVF